MKVSLVGSTSLLVLAAACTGQALRRDKGTEDVAPIIQELQRSVTEEKDFPSNCVRQVFQAAPDRLGRLQILGVPVSELNSVIFVSSDAFLETTLVVLYKHDGIWSLMSDSADATLRKRLSADEAEKLSERIHMVSKKLFHSSPLRRPFDAQDHGQCATIMSLSSEGVVASSYATSGQGDDAKSVFELLKQLDESLVSDEVR